MGKQVMILLEKEITEQNKLKQFVQSSKGTFVTTFTNDKLLIILKSEMGGETSEDVRMLAGSISHVLGNYQIEQLRVEDTTLYKHFPSLPKQQIVIAFVEGWYLGAYGYETYKSTQTHYLTNLHIEGDETIKKYVQLGKRRAEATAFSRDLTNDIPSVLNPKTFPRRLQTAFAETDVNVTVFDKTDLEKMKMNGILTVGQGSKYNPAYVELEYKGDQTKPLVVLVGKGVTFDTGGISLKRGRNLSDMRMDMGGAAAVAGAIKLLASIKAKVNVIALLPIVENMPDRLSVLPGDVIHYKNGHTVQIGNTDAEGRLILADGLIRAGELQADYIVDIATLTGSIMNALGSKLAGVFGDSSLSIKMKEIGDENGDYNWPMPLVDAYEAYLKSDYADFCNISSKGEAGSITAALFLRRFVPETAKWLHIDMAGVMESNEEKGYYSKAATGFGARLLADFTEHVSKDS